MSNLGLTLPGRDIFAPTQTSGAPRGAVMGQARTWAMEVETLIAAVIDGLAAIQGGWDASAGSFPGSGTADKGDAWRVTTAGTVDGKAFVEGDLIVAIADNASTSTYAANWVRVQSKDANAALLNVEGQMVTGGARITVKDLGTLDGEEITIDPGARPAQKITNNGAGTIKPGANYGLCRLIIVNAAGAGAIDTDEFYLFGDDFDTDDGSVFFVGVEIYDVAACLVVIKIV